MPLKRTATQVQGIRAATDNPMPGLESLDDVDFENAYNPYKY